MGRAPRKQLASRAARTSEPAKRFAFLDLAPFFAYNPASDEGVKVRTAKMNAAKLAADLIKDSKVEQLAEEMVEAYLGLYKLKDSPSGAEGLCSLERDVSEWAKRMVDCGDIEGIRVSFVYSAVRLCYMQLRIEKPMEDVP